MDETCDVVVIGMGVGGEEVAGRAADAGLEVVAVEKNLVGGECPYWGCVPSKMMLRAADALAEGDRVNRLSGSSQLNPDWSPVARRIREQATDNWNDEAAVRRHEDKGTKVLKGAARLVGPREIEVEGERYRARRGIVIATGTEPAAPPIEGLDRVPYWTNRQAIEAEAVPRSLLVLGGGPVGVELAQVFARFGAGVQVVEMAPHLLPLDEPENGEALARALAEDGIEVITGTAASQVRQEGDEVVVTLSDGRVERAERLLVATGRKTNLAALGVAAAGLDESARMLKPDEHMRVGDGIWAVGDVTEHGGFTHNAVYQGRIASADILGLEHTPADYSAVPRVTFTDPEVASVGLTEQQAQEQGLEIKIGSAPTSASSRGWIHGPGAEQGVSKLVADARRGVLVGASVMGPRAGDIIGFLVLAIRERIPVASLQDLIYPYPTFVRGLEDALAKIA